MWIKHILNQLPSDERIRLAERLQVKVPVHDRITKLHETLLEHYTSAALAERFMHLTQAERVSLELLSIVMEAEINGLFLQEAVRVVGAVNKEKGLSDQLIKQLAAKGFLFLIPQGWSEVVIVPREVAQFSVSLALENMHHELGSSQLTATREAEVQTTENCGLSLYHDVLTLVSAFSRDVVDITQKGHVYKRAMKPLLAKLRTKEHRFPDTLGEAIPRNYYFLEGFLKYYRIVSFGDRAVVNKSALNQLLRVSYVAWADLFYQFYMRRVYVGRIFPRTFLVNLLAGLDRESWLSADDLFQQIERRSASWGIPITRSQLNSVCYHPFTLLGLIEWGEDVTGRSYWRWTNWGREYLATHELELGGQLSDELYVQPNLEIIVPEQVLPAIRWSVEAFAELQQADTVFIYKLTRDRLLQALEAGWTVSAVADFLRAFSKIPVADNIVPTLQGWIGNYGKAVLWDVMVLKLEDESVAAMLKKSRGFAKWIVTSFSADTFVIHRKDEPYVRAWLEDLGITVPLQIHGAVNGAAENTAGGKLLWVEEEKKRKRDALLLYNLSALAPVASAYLVKTQVAQAKKIDRESFAE